MDGIETGEERVTELEKRGGRDIILGREVVIVG